MQAAKTSLNLFHEVMVEAKQEQKVPLVSFAASEGHSSQKERLEKRIEEQAKAYARSRSENDTNKSHGGRPGARDPDEDIEHWQCFYCGLHIDGFSEVCPASGCPGISPKTKLRLSQGTEAQRACYALQNGQPAQWWWLLVLTEWQRKVQAGEIAADRDPFQTFDREPEVQLDNRLGACTRPSGPQTGRSLDGALWQEVRKMYNQLNDATLLQNTDRRSANWTTPAQRFKEDDGRWNDSGNSWGQSTINGGKNLDWMVRADKMYAEQRHTRAEKGAVLLSRPDCDMRARVMWDIKIKEGEEWFHTTRKNLHATLHYKMKAAFLMKGKKSEN